jgi:phosphoglycerol transferase MdoB-like AlkP superfamily enzyme
MLLTLSTHEPFDVPVEPPAAKKSEPELFRNAARYTDRCLNDFFSAAQKKKWYPNTLFILVADHGHILPNRREYYDPNTHRIPLLFIGAGLPAGLKGTRIHQHGGQHDLPATILELNGIDSRDMPFSRNLLDTLQQKPAFLNYEAGIGWLEKDRQFVLLTDAGRTLSEYSHFGNNGDSISLLNRGKAYLQCLNNLFESY